MKPGVPIATGKGISGFLTYKVEPSVLGKIILAA